MIDAVVDGALSPLNWLFLAAALALLAAVRPSWRRAVVPALLLFVAAYLAMTPFVANRLVRRLESRVAAPASCSTARPDTVVVLAGGVDRLPAHVDAYGVLDAGARRRIEKGVEYSLRTGATLVMAGGPTADGWIPHADLMAAYARSLGVPADAVRLERASRTTWQNARNVAAMRPEVPRRIALATSAMHMPRAMLAFEAAGFEPCPLPADRQAIRAGLPGALWPDLVSLRKTQEALHEGVGGVHYAWMRHRHPDASR